MLAAEVDVPMRLHYWMLGALLLVGCAHSRGGSKATAEPESNWMMDRLKQQAAFDLNCGKEELRTVETGQWRYGVIGCNKRASYVMHACNRLTKECTYVLNGVIAEEPRPQSVATGEPSIPSNDDALAAPAADPAGPAGSL